MENFAQSSSTGDVFIANGTDQTLIWDGLSSSAVPAGVIAPTGTPFLTASGAGAITGTYYGWVRFVDARGNYSNLSPVSFPAVASNNGQIDYINVQVPTVGTVVRRQIIRNTNGSVGAVDPLTGETRNIAYVDIDTTDISSTSFTSFRVDTDLATQEQVDIDAASIENGVPPDYKPFLVWHQNLMFFLGIEPYRRGSCSVELGSDVVYGYNTEWKSNWVGRFLYIPGAPKNYEIIGVTVTASAQVITLAEPYGGDTDLWAEYAVRPAPAEANSFNWSAPGNPEAVNPLDALVLPEDGDDVVGGFNYGAYLYAAKKKHLYRIITQGDPRNDGRVFLACNRGLVNIRSFAIVDETCYMLDTGGIYAYKGDDQGEPISTPIQDMFNNNPGTGQKINWLASRYFHACHSPNEEVVRFFVALAGDYVPRHAIVVAYKVMKIWVESLPFRAGASVTSKIGGRMGTVQEAVEQYYVGSTGGRVLAPLGGALDGNAKGGTVRGTVTDADWLSLTDDQAQFVSGCVNSPVAITGGKGRGQVRYVVERTSSKLTLDRPWRIMPDTTSTYCVGGVAYTYSTQRIRWAPGEQQTARSVELEYQPTPKVPNTMRVGVAPDFQDPVLTAWDIDRGFREFVVAEKGQRGQDVALSNPGGYTLLEYNSLREGTTDGAMGRTFRLVLSGVANEEQVRLGTVLLAGATG